MSQSQYLLLLLLLLVAALTRPAAAGSLSLSRTTGLQKSCQQLPRSRLARGAGGSAVPALLLLSPWQLSR